VCVLARSLETGEVLRGGGGEGDGDRKPVCTFWKKNCECLSRLVF